MEQCQKSVVSGSIETSLRGQSILKTPLLNKGVAFTSEERHELHLRGLLPPGIVTLDQQLQWAYNAYKRKSNPVDKHLFLRGLQDNNEVLFYRLVSEHIVEMAPIIYTPVIGAICQEFSHHYRRPRGLFISYPDMDHIDEILDNWPQDDVRLVVVTDGERVLGLGDQGLGGMGISVGKLALYTLCAGIHPSLTLPIFLDAGTDNAQLLDDPVYLGWRHNRIRGADYDAFVDAFVTALFRRFPNALLHWEDFAKNNARKLLERYQDKVCSFNDDIQGTAAVTLAGLLAAVKVSGPPLTAQRIAIVGAGSAGVGIADLVVKAMTEEGLTEEQAIDRIWLFNSRGLVNSAQTGLEPAVARYSKNGAILVAHGLRCEEPNLLQEVISNVHPTALIGVSGQGGSFSEGLIREMTRHVTRPIIFPLSNPTSHSEAVPADLMIWTEGRALIATGSPFAPVYYGGKEYHITQCNNSLIFPGLGLAVMATQCQRVVTDMLVAAGRALAKLSPALVDSHMPLLPALDQSRHVAKCVATAVAHAAMNANVADSLLDSDLSDRIDSLMWAPDYPEIRSREGF
ncbi:MAG: NAD-dependent malic enzyme [Chlamydiales bacterium]|nr:NAD-dependent malic enzyme [Chlamydiales bacterium]